MAKKELTQKQILTKIATAIEKQLGADDTFILITNTDKGVSTITNMKSRIEVLGCVELAKADFAIDGIVKESNINQMG